MLASVFLHPSHCIPKMPALTDAGQSHFSNADSKCQMWFESYVPKAHQNTTRPFWQSVPSCSYTRPPPLPWGQYGHKDEAICVFFTTLLPPTRDNKNVTLWLALRFFMVPDSWSLTTHLPCDTSSSNYRGGAMQHFHVHLSMYQVTPERPCLNNGMITCKERMKHTHTYIYIYIYICCRVNNLAIISQ